MGSPAQVPSDPRWIVQIRRTNPPVRRHRPRVARRGSANRGRISSRRDPDVPDAAAGHLRDAGREVGPGSPGEVMLFMLRHLLRNRSPPASTDGWRLDTADGLDSRRLRPPAVLQHQSSLCLHRVAGRAHAPLLGHAALHGGARAARSPGGSRGRDERLLDDTTDPSGRPRRVEAAPAVDGARSRTDGLDDGAHGHVPRHLPAR